MEAVSEFTSKPEDFMLIPQLDRITQQSAIMGGKASIRGMRVTVGMIVGQIGAGHSRWAVFLGSAGFPAVHWTARGAVNASDAEIMTFTAEHDPIVLTQDLDFSVILAAMQGALRQAGDDLTSGALFTLDLHPARVAPVTPD